MEAFARVLFGADGSPGAQDAARFLVRLLPRDGSVEVNVLTVLSYGLYPERTPDGDPALDDKDAAIDAATDSVVAIFDDAGIKHHVSHRYGSPSAGIIEECDEWQPDLVVLGSRGLRGAARMFGASVSQRVVRETSTPVLIVPSPTDRPPFASR